MHPSGIQFGLSRGLLQLCGGEVHVSDDLLESVSVEAHLYVSLGKQPTHDAIFTNIVARIAQDALAQETEGRRQEVVPFFTGLSRALYHSLVSAAERANLGRKQGRGFMTNEKIWQEFSERALDIKPGKSLAKIRKSLFKECRDIVSRHYAERDPENARHADMMALFLFNFWNGTGLLPMTEAVVILTSST